MLITVKLSDRMHAEDMLTNQKLLSLLEMLKVHNITNTNTLVFLCCQLIFEHGE